MKALQVFAYFENRRNGVAGLTRKLNLRRFGLVTDRTIGAKVEYVGRFLQGRNDW